MTCGYMRDVATANTWTFCKLLFRWNGSVWKAIHMELIIWLFIFVNIRTVYEFFLLDTDAAGTYEHIVIRCREVLETGVTQRNLSVCRSRPNAVPS